MYRRQTMINYSKNPTPGRLQNRLMNTCATIRLQSNAMIPLVKTDTLAPETLNLTDGEVHVWHANLGNSPALLQPLHQTLSPDECARANRFRFDRDKNRFIAARGLLREILSHYLGTMPEEITFIYNAQGKPALRNDTYQKNLRFNVSH